MLLFRVLFIFVFLLPLGLRAGVVKGIVSDTTGQPLPYVAVMVKNSAYGVNSNLGGAYFLELNPGNYTLLFSQLGFASVEKAITITDGKPLVLNVVMYPVAKQLNTVTITTKGDREKGREIMRKVIDNRSAYWDRVSTYQCRTYQKASLEKVSKNPEKRDSALVKLEQKWQKDTANENDSERKRKRKEANYEAMQEQLKDQRLNLIETIGETFFKKPGNYKENILAQHDFTQQKTREEGSYVVNDGTSLTVQYGEYEMAPVSVMADNPYLLVNDAQSADFNFYRNQIDMPAICNRPLLSPAAGTALLNYRFELLLTFTENGKQLHKIAVNPLFPADALFSGFIFVEDSTWAIVSVNLSVNRAVLISCKEFNVIQDYRETAPGIYLPVRREFNYTIIDDEFNVIGNVRMDHSRYQVNVEFPRGLFNNEVRHFESDAFDKDSTFWAAERTIELDEKELIFIEQADSIQAYFGTQEYIEESDSLFNRINIWSFLINGVGHRNSLKGYEFYIAPIAEQIVLLGVGGYRHRLIGSYSKRFDNGKQIETEGMLDYGPYNRDLRAKAGVGYTYQPKRFIRTFVRGGDFYEQINPFSSFADFFSLGNWTRTREVSVAQRAEIVNGLFGEITFEYSDQSPITDMQLRPFWDSIYVALAQPVNFQRYTKTEIRVELRYRHKQKYTIKKNRKIILGSKYPELRLFYRKGIPGLLGSEVNFDYLEIGTFDDIRLKRFGTSHFNIQYGVFLNKASLRRLEYKYFRGSEILFFVAPLQSFQLLGERLLFTSNSFFRANFIHHFDGVFGSKVPLLGRAKITLAVGGGTLIVPEINFYHQEVFAGLERVFTLFGQPFRLGFFAVTADNTLNDPVITWKVGIGVFNPFTRKWNW
ncbi:MAG: DUF5686 and carboxypeptidase regulatory-like domain-containing protein [Bacteroidota bacterium]|jgi:hypothetical protein